MGPSGEVKVMVPVGNAHVGAIVSDATGAGSVGMAAIVTILGADTQPVVVFLTVMLWLPGANPLISVLV